MCPPSIYSTLIHIFVFLLHSYWPFEPTMYIFILYPLVKEVCNPLGTICLALHLTIKIGASVNEWHIVCSSFYEEKKNIASEWS